jgi:hypothetical protein
MAHCCLSCFGRCITDMLGGSCAIEREGAGDQASGISRHHSHSKAVSTARPPTPNHCTSADVVWLLAAKGLYPLATMGIFTPGAIIMVPPAGSLRVAQHPLDSSCRIPAPTSMLRRCAIIGCRLHGAQQPAAAVQPTAAAAAHRQTIRYDTESRGTMYNKVPGPRPDYFLIELLLGLRTGCAYEIQGSTVPLLPPRAYNV